MRGKEVFKWVELQAGRAQRKTKFKQAQASTRNAYESRMTEGLADIAQALFQIDLRLDRLEKKLDGRG